LVLSDWPAEDAALVRVVDAFPEQPAAVADALGRDEDPLGIHAVEDVAEALALLADQVLGRHFQILDEHLGRVVVDERLDRPNVDAIALGRLEIDQEHGKAFGALLDLIPRRRASEEQHQVGVKGARGPDLLPVDDVMVAIPDRAGLDLGGVGSGRRFGDAESLQAQLSGRDGGQVALLLLIAAVPQQRSHDVHLSVGGARGAARGVDLLQDHGGRPERQPGAAILLRDQGCEKPGLGQGLHELRRISALVVQVAPILARKTFADAADRLPQLRIILADRHADVGADEGWVVVVHRASFQVAAATGR
jgi:hypothetical protein